MPEMSNNIYAALARVQGELKAPKDAFNTFGKYNYRTAESILRAAKPACERQGIALTLSEDIRQVGERYYIVSTATATLISDPSQQISVTTPVREALERSGMDASQITGGAVSYARKYALCGLLAVDDAKNDPDTGQAPAPAKTPAPVPSICADCGKPIVDYDLHKRHYSAKSLEAESIRRYQQPLCGECFHSRYKAEKAADKQGQVC